MNCQHKTVRTLVRLVLTSSIFLGTLSANVRAQTPAPSIRDLKTRQYAERILFPDAPPVNSASIDQRYSAQTITSADELRDDTRVVFQSFRDGNWEVYRANGDFGEQNNATNNGSADLYPELSFNGQKIVFASNRDGNFEIYSMNWDGSGLTRLTNNGAADAMPSWSRDGSKIAFVSTRDGNQEIYLMNANGSGQTRITNTGHFEYDPSWSISGRLAWANGDASSENGWIVVANEDGSGQTSVTFVRYLGSPVWSPDGTKLLIDGDTDNDFFNELIVVDFSPGGSILTVYDPPGQYVDAWSSSWGPDGNTLAFTRVEYRVEGNSLVKNHSYLETVPVSGGTSSRKTGTDRDELANWRWNDVWAPRTNSLRIDDCFKIYPYSPDYWANATISWNSKDFGPSGISYFMLQYRLEGSTVWQTLGTTSYYSGNFSFYYNQTGKVVHVRVIAIDYAGNTEVASTREQDLLRTKTCLGIATINHIDNKGRNIPHSDVGFHPLSTAGAYTQTSDLIGHYRTEVITFGTFLSNKMGYGSFPNFGKKHEYIAYEYLVYLPPPDNQIADPSFENPLSENTWDPPLTRLDNDNISFHSGNVGLGISGISGQAKREFFVPLNLHKPTLSFFFQDYANGTDQIMLGISSNNISSTFVYTSTITDNQNWWFASIDMSAYAGQTITLTLTELSNQDLIIDDISLGSWLTPVISDTSIHELPANAPATRLTITGLNFINAPTVKLNNTPLTNVTWLGDGSLQATIPANLPFGRYDLWVTNPGGQEAVSPSAIRVGKEIFLPIGFRDY